MKNWMKDDIGGNNFLLIIGSFFIIGAIFVCINMMMNFFDLNFMVSLSEAIKFKVTDVHILGGTLSLGCLFIIWAFKIG